VPTRGGLAVSGDVLVGVPWAEGRHAGEDPAVHRAVSHNKERIIQPKM